ncbi:hypothetical protein H5W18_05005 [Lactobacillus sp. Marseille-P7033]|nr:hypothetical protein [Lactobacillus sp. Marseille-P7033]NGC78981.1 hypothetical protein [Limosilactobacillus reuteri]
MKSVDGTMISAVMAFIASLIACNLTFKGKIHEESGWREKLLKLSYAELISKKELIQLQSFVNPLAKFDGLKNLDGLINKLCQDEQAVVKKYGGYLPDKEAEQFRFLCRALQKHDWINQTKFFGFKWYGQHKLTKQLTQKFFKDWIVVTE